MTCREFLLEIAICDGIAQSTNVEGADGFVFRGIQSRHGGGTFQKLVSHRIINTIVTVLNVLVGKRIIRICWLLMPVNITIFFYTKLDQPTYLEYFI